MYTVYSIRKRFFLPLSFLILFALTFMFAGCGAASAGGTSTVGAASTPAPIPASTAIKGYGSTNGCPSDMVVGAAQTKANVMLQSSDANTTIIAHNGDVIEVRLPFGHKWDGPIASQGVLQLQSPPGYALKTSNVCVWRFVAQGTGSVLLNFSGRPLCKKGQMCALFIMAVPFKIDVK